MSEESVQNKMGSLDEVLGLMDRVNEVFSYEVWVPSLKRNVMFREINTNQQKRLIKAIIDSPIYNTQFIFALRKVIQENCVDKTINVDDLTIIDKLIIAMKMRSVSISDVVELKVPLKDGKSTQRAISLEKILGELKNTVSIPDDATFTDDKNIYEVKCGLPTISTEYKLEDELRRNIEEKEVKSYEELRKNIGDVFMGEVAKYIRSISINNGEDITKIDLSSINFKDRMTLIGRLPEKVTKKVVEYIDTTKKEINKITLVKVNIGTEEEPEYKEENFSIDAGFFTGS